MYLTAEELVTPGGPSAPVWLFLTAILSLIVTNVFQLINTKVAAKEAARKAAVVAEKVDEVRTSAEQAVSNTAGISDGFTGNTTRTLNIIYHAVQDIEQRMSDHLVWHLNQEGAAHHGHQQPAQQDRPHHPRPLG